MTQSPYRPPQNLESTENEGAYQDMDALTLTPLVKAASMLLLAVALLSLLAGIQLLAMVRLAPWLSFMPWVFVGLAPFGLPVARLLFRMKKNGAIAGVIFSSLVSLISLGWAIFSVNAGLLLLLQGVLPLMSIAAVVLCLLSIDPTRRAEATRAHFAKEDLELNF
ncbi:MAG: hypothetical protein JXR76_23325 [Deltaproteobacteria bacterium]|nr:hypothetical protein [Deltaproteobacteria bacterium]